MINSIDGELLISEEIGKGGWSVVRKGILNSTGKVVAIKLESISKTSLHFKETAIMSKLQGIEGIPLVYKTGTQGSFNYIAMQKLHVTLHQLATRGFLNVQNVMARAVQLLGTIEKMHKRGVIHQDLQPKNLMTSEDFFQTYIIDFGLSTFITKQSMRKPQIVGIIGTPTFASMSALLGFEQDFKDDLESLGYILVWLICGPLPWEPYANDRTLDNLKSLRARTPSSVICKGCPDELIYFLNYTKSLKFGDVPDYKLLRRVFESACQKLVQAAMVPLPSSPVKTPRSLNRDKPKALECCKEPNGRLTKSFILLPKQAITPYSNPGKVRRMSQDVSVCKLGGTFLETDKQLFKIENTQHNSRCSDASISPTSLLGNRSQNTKQVKKMPKPPLIKIIDGDGKNSLLEASGQVEGSKSDIYSSAIEEFKPSVLNRPRPRSVNACDRTDNLSPSKSKSASGCNERSFDHEDVEDYSRLTTLKMPFRDLKSLQIYSGKTSANSAFEAKNSPIMKSSITTLQATTPSFSATTRTTIKEMRKSPETKNKDGNCCVF